MSGIIFYGTKDLDRTREFYMSRVGMDIWLEQADCIIFQHGNLLLGFCQRDRCENKGIITIFFESREEVDAHYERLRDIATTEPGEIQKYRIYRFFAIDPENRCLEFQYFLDTIPSLGF